MLICVPKTDAASALVRLSEYLFRYYAKKVIILLDEYDTPMQEAYVHGYWKELVEFMRGLFNFAFKSNPCLERAIMTGITKIDIGDASKPIREGNVSLKEDFIDRRLYQRRY